jgi:hypothetical protein
MELPMQTDNVMIIAAWLVEGAALSDLLRAAGREEHAENLDFAMSEVRDIVVRQVGEMVLAELMDVFADRLWSSESPFDTPGSQEIH